MRELVERNEFAFYTRSSLLSLSGIRIPQLWKFAVGVSFSTMTRSSRRLSTGTRNAVFPRNTFRKNHFYRRLAAPRLRRSRRISSSSLAFPRVGKKDSRRQVIKAKQQFPRAAPGRKNAGACQTFIRQLEKRTCAPALQSKLSGNLNYSLPVDLAAKGDYHH